jgi:glucose/arabinose dehydrogenase
MRLLAVVAVALCCALGRSPSADATFTDPAFIDTLVTTGLTRATAMTWGPGGLLWVTEQDGKVRVIRKGDLLTTPFVSMTVDGTGERGLLGIAFDPIFTQNHYVYLYNTKRAGADPVKNPPYNQISRFTSDQEVAVPMSGVRIFRLPALGPDTHNGGAIHFGRDGKLYVAVGDNNLDGQPSQSLGSLFGKILRINPDGTIPADNPFYAQTNVVGANKAIWALGFRNPFTFAFLRNSSRMFVNDVGAHRFEEIDDVVAGGNYGWKHCEGPFALSTTNPCTAMFPSHRDPLFYYEHGTTDTTGCAITGGAFYNPPVAYFPSTYVGKYFYADFCSGWLRLLDPATATDSLFATGLGRPVDLQLWNDGALYYLDRAAGSVHRISYLGQPTLANPQPTSGVAGIERVKLRGTYLAGVSSITFNGEPATFVKVVWDTWVRTMAPRGATSGPIVLTTPAGTATVNFTITLTITGLSALSGNPGDAITITGDGFTGATAVRFRERSASFTVDSPTQITATVPTGSGTGTVYVTTPAGTTPSKDSFTIN